uniref:Ribosomal protein S16 n=1 Tax=Sciadococcus taiwanensis TaxID=3028030 RepID=A0A9Y1MWJ7_9RHOD|nr:ribosomal protein S16 [Sciadococcus taiwanensis]
MIKVRLKRFGRKGKPHYRIVIINSKAKRDGKTIEEVGYYNPISKELYFTKSRIEEWIREGAKPSNTVQDLLNKTYTKLTT